VALEFVIKSAPAYPQARAEAFRRAGLLFAASLVLQGSTRIVGALSTDQNPSAVAGA
jgi:hypothetical protein